jgi:hypothetical protein
MIVFKKTKFKHFRKAKALVAREEAGEDVDVEFLEFSMSLVDRWDFVDEETGEELDPRNPEAMYELTSEQVGELTAGFNARFQDMGNTVPKANAGLSPSTSTPSSQVESPAPHQTG